MMPHAHAADAFDLEEGASASDPASDPSAILKHEGIGRGRGQNQNIILTGGGIKAPVMLRELRVEFPGALYHVMSRGDRREAIFQDDVDRQDFIKTLAEGCQKTGFEVA